MSRAIPFYHSWNFDMVRDAVHHINVNRQVAFTRVRMRGSPCGYWMEAIETGEVLPLGAAQTFRDYIAGRLGTRSWAVFRSRAHRNAALYDRPITVAEFDSIKTDWVADGGDPLEVGREPGTGQIKATITQTAA
jgi:hypothetical protein